MVLDPLLLYGVRAIDAPTLIVQLAITLLLVFMNAFFVAAEFALVKVRPTRIAEAAHAKIAGALTVQRIHRHLDSYLSATQLGVTLASLALGWIGEQAIAAVIRPLFEHLGAFLSTAVSHALGIVVAF